LVYAVAAAILLIALASLFAPVYLKFDTLGKSFRIGWMGLGFGRRWDRRKPAPVKAEPERKKKFPAQAIGLHLFQERDLVFELVQKAHRPLMRLLRSVSVQNVEASLSTPDPLWNGVLYGIGCSLPWKNVHLSANFRNLNYAKGELHLYLYKVVEAAVPLLIGLPYRRIIKAFLSIRKAAEG
jgi:hypothetical protein